MKTLTKILGTGLLLAGLNLNAAVLQIDKSHSEVAFSVKHMMISNVKGEFSEFDAKIDYDLKSREFKALEAVVIADSIDTGIEQRDDHLRSADFFDIEKYPDIVFTMTSYKPQGQEGIMTGELNIHGVTKTVKLYVVENGSIKDNKGNTKVGFTLEGKINRKDFGLTWNKVIEAGGFAIGDTVKITIELETVVK